MASEKCFDDVHETDMRSDKLFITRSIPYIGILQLVVTFQGRCFDDVHETDMRSDTLVITCSIPNIGILQLVVTFQGRIQDVLMTSAKQTCAVINWS